MKRVAIVLGAAVRPDGSASPVLRRRAEEAARLFLTGEVDEIIASGGVPRAGKSEAEVIREVCIEAGVPHGVVTCESASTNTLENIRYSAKLLDKDAEVTLVTDTYHAPRARLIARDVGLTVNTVSPAHRPASWRRVIRGYFREAAALGLYAIRKVTRPKAFRD